MNNEYISIYRHTHTHKHTHIYIYMCVCVCVCAHLFICINLCVIFLSIYLTSSAFFELRASIISVIVAAFIGRQHSWDYFNKTFWNATLLVRPFLLGLLAVALFGALATNFRLGRKCLTPRKRSSLLQHGVAHSSKKSWYYEFFN
jgi:hypothetical protein